MQSVGCWMMSVECVVNRGRRELLCEFLSDDASVAWFVWLPVGG